MEVRALAGTVQALSGSLISIGYNCAVIREENNFSPKIFGD